MRVTGSKVVLFLALLLLSPAGVRAQQGKITGRVIDGATAQAVSSAQVFLEDESVGTISNIDGRFVLRDIPAGTHTIVVQMIGYNPKSVTGVVLDAGGVAVVDISLEIAAVAIQGITVEAAVEAGSTAALLNERQTEAFVVDAIGAEQISRSPDGDAGAALKRVPGLSVVDGKFAYVRGLGERYSGTTLNGSPLASPMPDRKVVPLDVIPTSLLESIVTAKSYSPDKPGDYAGGLVELRTKDFPTRRIFSVSASSGFNSVTTFEDGLRYGGGGLDFLGFDDGTRSLPSLVPSDQRVTFPTFSRLDLERFGESFSGDWGPVVDALPPNTSLGVSFGDDLSLFDRSLGVLASATYSNQFGRKDGIIERVFASAGVSDPEIDYRGESTVRSVSLGGLANVSYDLSPTTRLTANLLYSRLMDDEARVYEGFNLDSNSDQRNYRLRFLAQTLTNGQLKGEHKLGFLGNAKFDWRGAWSRAERYEPNTREVLYREEDGEFLFENFVSSGSVFHQDLVDDTYSGSADLALPFSIGGDDRQGSLAFGGTYSTKQRDVFTRRFRFLVVPGGVIDENVRRLDPNELFNANTIAQDGFELQEATFRPDNYDAKEEIGGAYAKLELQPHSAVKVMTGVRVESARQSVDPRDLFDNGQAPIPGANLDQTDLLPALNVTLQVAEGMNVRLGASQTLARPQLRELAPFAFADYAGGYLTVGNPELTRSLIQNYDARWEWFAGSGAVLAMSGFYKTFDGPIEVAVLPSSELLKTWVNGGSANNYGIEVEMRTSLAFLSPKLRDVSINTNLTLVQSEVTTPAKIRVYIPGEGGSDLPVVPKNRALQGQSPYVVNAGLTYASPGGWMASVLFNRFGRRIDAVGGQATPDVFEEARSQLDVVLERTLFSGTKVKLSASRLVGNEIEFTQGGGLLRRWDTGRTVSMSVGWSPSGL